MTNGIDPNFQASVLKEANNTRIPNRSFFDTLKLFRIYFVYACGFYSSIFRGTSVFKLVVNANRRSMFRFQFISFRCFCFDIQYVTAESEDTQQNDSRNAQNIHINNIVSCCCATFHKRDYISVVRLLFTFQLHNMARFISVKSSNELINGLLLHVFCWRA